MPLIRIDGKDYREFVKSWIGASGTLNERNGYYVFEVRGKGGSDQMAEVGNDFARFRRRASTIYIPLPLLAIESW